MSKPDKFMFAIGEKQALIIVSAIQKPKTRARRLLSKLPIPDIS